MDGEHLLPRVLSEHELILLAEPVLKPLGSGHRHFLHQGMSTLLPVNVTDDAVLDSFDQPWFG